jgi:hypothetical protein
MFGFSSVHLAGDATDADPARIVLLHRHADMADETPDDVARAEVERGVYMIATLLGDAGLVANVADLKRVLLTAQEQLGAVTYYSVLVGLVTTTRVVVAAIGDVNVYDWTEGRAERVLSATTVEVGGARLLASALGLGYADDQVQAVEVSLAARGPVVIGIGVDLTTVPPIGGAAMSATDLVAHILKRLPRDRASIVGVVASA